MLIEFYEIDTRLGMFVAFFKDLIDFPFNLRFSEANQISYSMDFNSIWKLLRF